MVLESCALFLRLWKVVLESRLGELCVRFSSFSQEIRSTFVIEFRRIYFTFLEKLYWRVICSCYNFSQEIRGVLFIEKIILHFHMEN